MQSTAIKQILNSTERNLRKAIELVQIHLSVYQQTEISDIPYYQVIGFDFKEIETTLNHALTGVLIVRHCAKPPYLTVIKGGVK